MKFGRGKVRTAWIVVLAFCLFVFVAFDGFALYLVIRDPADTRNWRALLGIILLTGVAYQPLRTRLKSPR